MNLHSSLECPLSQIEEVAVMGEHDDLCGFCEIWENFENGCFALLIECYENVVHDEWDWSAGVDELFHAGEFEREKKWWGGARRKGRKVNEYAWKVSAEEIAARNYNLDCKNPHEVEVNHGDPDELMQEYLDISQQVKNAQNALKQELMQALQQTRGN